jgi:hypothetical protein
MRPQKLIATTVMFQFRFRRMGLAIDFDNEVSFEAGEVSDVGTDGMLLVKVKAVGGVIAQL